MDYVKQMAKERQILQRSMHHVENHTSSICVTEFMHAEAKCLRDCTSKIGLNSAGATDCCKMLIILSSPSIATQLFLVLVSCVIAAGTAPSGTTAALVEQPVPHE